MPRFLAIDWDDSEIRIASANVQGDKVSVDDLVSKPLADPANVQDALRGLIAEHKLKATEALICAPRSSVELRSVTVPPVPDEELPDIIRFQALREFSELSDDWPIDYLPVSADEHGITVKAAAMSPKCLREITQPIEACEIKPVGLMLRPTAIASIARKMDPHEGGLRLLVDQLDTKIELTVIDGLNIQLMRTINLPPGDNAEQRNSVLTSEIQRTVVATQNQTNNNIETVVFFGSKEMRQSQADLTQSKLNLKTECINPLDSVSVSGRVALGQVDSGRFAAAIGMLCEQASEENETIDLLRPRKPVEPPSRRNLYSLLGLTAACVVLAAIAGVWYQLDQFDREIKSLRSTAYSQKEQAEMATARIEKAASVLHWEKSSVNVLAELDRISQKMPPPEEIQLSQARGMIDQTGNGKITLQGYAKESASLETAVTNLADDNHKLQLPMAQKTKGSEKYAWTFNKSITVVNVTEEEAEARKLKSKRRMLRPRPLNN
ncbi:type IV pilus biogenesis protein PilM [Planctomycetota bacterium]